MFTELYVVGGVVHLGMAHANRDRKSRVVFLHSSRYQ